MKVIASIAPSPIFRHLSSLSFAHPLPSVSHFLAFSDPLLFSRLFSSPVPLILSLATSHPLLPPLDQALCKTCSQSMLAVRTHLPLAIGCGVSLLTRFLATLALFRRRFDIPLKKRGRLDWSSQSTSPFRRLVYARHRHERTLPRIHLSLKGKEAIEERTMCLVGSLSETQSLCHTPLSCRLQRARRSATIWRKPQTSNRHMSNSRHG
jgi:hypothetical protein